jgi:glycosyltransferase involved in cell wall biosynthesis
MQRRGNRKLNSAAKSLQALEGARVSVIIPAYNVAPYIRDTLESVFAQTETAYEVIVVNDGSPDTPALEEVLQPFRSRIVYLKQENRGLAGARNTGIQAATGNFIALLDADDLWMPTYIERQTRFLCHHPEYDLVYCNAVFFGNSIYDGKEYMAVCPSSGEATPAAIISRQCHVFVSVMARARAMQEIGFDPTLRSCEDFDCWLRFTSSGRKIGYHREILVRYRKHAASLSANPTWMAESSLKVLGKARSLWPAGSDELSLLEQATAAKTAELAAIRGKIALRSGDVNGAAAYLTEANRFYRSSKIRIVLSLLELAPGLVRFLFRLRGSLLPAYSETPIR